MNKWTDHEPKPIAVPLNGLSQIDNGKKILKLYNWRLIEICNRGLIKFLFEKKINKKYFKSVKNLIAGKVYKKSHLHFQKDSLLSR